MPGGKPADVRCVQLDEQDRCKLFGRPERPPVCQSLRPEWSMCGNTKEHDAVLDAVGFARSRCRFGHGAEHRIAPSRPSISAFSLVDSYHCSRYNTQTRRLTPTMFLEVLGRAQMLLGTSGRSSAVR